MFPNWVIIGAPKCSTTSLFRWLVDHPQACGFPDKETRYFVDPTSHLFRPDRNFRDHGLAGYERLFSTCSRDARVIVDATPSFLYSRTALRELPQIPSCPSFIVILRQPVAQLRSMYLYFQQNWNRIPRDMSFAQFISAVDAGEDLFSGNVLVANALEHAWYPKYLRRWLQEVGRERLVVLLFDELVGQPRSTMQHLARRMHIDPAFYDRYDFAPDNATYEVRNPLLQRLNIAVRPWLPKGAFYRGARHVYRRLNTRPKTVHRASEVERALSRRFLPMLDELESDFGLDMRNWRSDLEATLEPEPPSGSGQSTGPGRPALRAAGDANVSPTPGY